MDEKKPHFLASIKYAVPLVGRAPYYLDAGFLTVGSVTILLFLIGLLGLKHWSRGSGSGGFIAGGSLRAAASLCDGLF